MMNHVFLALAFLSLTSAQAQTGWHWKCGASAGTIVGYEDFDWEDIKRFDIVNERISLGVRPTFGVGFDKQVAKKSTVGADFNLLWHLFSVDEWYSRGRVKGEFHLLNAQTSGRFTLQPLRWLHIRLGLSGLVRLVNFGDVEESGFGPSGAYTRPAQARDFFNPVLVMPVVGLVYPGQKVGLELIVGHSLTDFDAHYTRQLFSWQISVFRVAKR